MSNFDRMDNCFEGDRSIEKKNEVLKKTFELINETSLRKSGQHQSYVTWVVLSVFFQIVKFADAYETGLSAFKTDVNDRSILATSKENNDALTKSNIFQGRQNEEFYGEER